MSNPTLQFLVQADRIQPSIPSAPNSPDSETRRIWLAVKVTAYWEGIGTGIQDVDEKFFCDALLPWRWELSSSAGVTDGPVGQWDPNSPECWMVWRVDLPIDVNDSPTPIPASPSSINVPEHPSNLTRGLRDLLFAEDGSDQIGLLTRAIRSIVYPDYPDLKVDPSSLGKFAESGSTHYTVAGFIERLAVAPHPLPVLSRAHGLLELNLDEPPTDKTIFLVAPRLALRREGKTVSLNPEGSPKRDSEGNKLDAKSWAVDLAKVAPAGDDGLADIEAKVRIQGSLRLTEIESGTRLKMLQQWVKVGEDNVDDGLGSAQDAATLPHRLSQILDPLLRLRSVLRPTLKAWIEQDPNAHGILLTQKADIICKGLNFIACQVLWTRLDAVGRFECPLVSRLNSEGTRALVIEHLGTYTNLHLDVLAASTPDQETFLKAALRVSYRVFDQCNEEAIKEKLLPFTVEVLNKALSDSGLQVEAVLDEDLYSELEDEAILKRLWRSPGILQRLRQTPPPPGDFIRVFELVDSPDQDKDCITLRSLNQEVSLESLEAVPNTDDQLDGNAIRAECSLVFGAPFIEGLVSGRQDWKSIDPSIESISPKSLSIRLRDAMLSLVCGQDGGLSNGSLYGQYLQAFSATDFSGQPVLDFMKMLLLAMAQEATDLAERLIPDVHPGDRISSIPLPLTLAIDQLQTFPRSIDHWTRLSGYGLLLARNSGAPPNPVFRSLNASTLHVGTSTDEALRNLGTPLEWRPRRVGRDWRETSLVDPVPYAPSDQVGISDAIAEYANSWINTTMPGDPSLDAERLQDPNKKPAHDDALIRFGPPQPTDTVKLPALSFGYEYSMAAHLITCGGILAPELRSRDNPYIYTESQDGALPPPPQWAQKSQSYLRTVPISAPIIKIEDQYLQPKRMGISYLADELPQRIPARVLQPKPYRWNWDPTTGRAQVDWESATAEQAGIRFEAVITQLADQIDHEVIIALTIKQGESHQLTYQIPASKVADFELWVRIDLLFNKNPLIITLKACREFRSVYDFDDTNWECQKESIMEFTFPLLSEEKPTPILEISTDSLESSIAFEPVRVIPLQAPSASEPTKWLPIPYPSQNTNSKTTALLISTIEPGFCVAPFNTEPNGPTTSSPQLKVSWPSVDRHTWERWVNAQLFDWDSNDNSDMDLRTKTIDALNLVQTRSAPSSRDHSAVLNDPAVTALWFELWEIYPHRSPVSVTGFLLPKPPSDILKPESLIFDVEVKANSSQTQQPCIMLDNDNVIIVTCPLDYQSSIYELRVFPVVAPRNRTFGRTPTIDRLGRAVAEMLSPIPPKLISAEDRRDLQEWLIGPPARIALEVASTPEAARIQEDLDGGSECLRLVVESDGRRLAQVRFPDKISQNIFTIARLRRFESLTLLPQRWTWRGHPLPPTAADPTLLPPIDSDSSNERKMFDSDDAFLDWAEDDYNTLKSSILRPHHLPFRHQDGRRDIDAEVDEPMPLILERDLDWRGGWQLWRFRLSLTSRYAPLYKPQYRDKALITLPDRTTWLEHDLLDADNGRQPAVPSLAIIVPLTEPFDKDGSVPPILALFNGPMHAEHHFGDGIVVLVETARYGQQALQEIGADPIRSVESVRNSTVVPIRVDGPIGYGFDVGVSNPTFGHSGFLITPVPTAAKPFKPWSFMKLSFMRLENPLGLAKGTFVRDKQPWQLSGKAKGMDNDQQPSAQAIQYEGLLLQLNGSELWGDSPRTLIVQAAMGQATNAPGSRRVRLHFDHDTDGETLKIRCESLSYETTPSGVIENVCDEGVYSFPNKTVFIRMIVSGTDDSSARVLIHAWINENDSRRSHASLESGSWLALFQLPLAWNLPPNAQPTGARPTPLLEVIDPVDTQFGKRLQAFPVRLSAPTQSVWCQFTSASSQFSIKDSLSSESLVSIEQLEAICTTNAIAVEAWKSLRFRRRIDNGQNIFIQQPVFQPNAQVTERLLVVFTEWIVTQGLGGGSEGRVEQPILIDFLSSNNLGESCLEVALMEDGHLPLWSNKVEGGHFKWPHAPMRPAHVRLMKLLLPLTDEKTRFSCLLKLFGEPNALFEENYSENVQDAAGGILLSISRPTSWRCEPSVT